MQDPHKKPKNKVHSLLIDYDNVRYMFCTKAYSPVEMQVFILWQQLPKRPMQSYIIWCLCPWWMMTALLANNPSETNHPFIRLHPCSLYHGPYSQWEAIRCLKSAEPPYLVPVALIRLIAYMQSITAHHIYYKRRWLWPYLVTSTHIFDDFNKVFKYL